MIHLSKISCNVSKSIAALLLVSSLIGCAGVIVGGAVVGTIAATDRRSLGSQTDDEAINIKGENRAAAISGKMGHVNVNVFNRKVLLTGEVSNQKMKMRVEREIAKIDGVASVVNDLKIGTVPTLTSRSSDTLITTKVKASFIDARDLYASAYKVVTERGVVYLMGRVTQREGERAAKIAQGVNGVVKVVKVFDVITEEELQRMTKEHVPTSKK